jgi:hypothetical protein
MFITSPEGLPPFWTYRRLTDSQLLDPSGQLYDVAMINWAGNDYHWADLIDKSATEQRRILVEAKRLALGFLHWLQTEAPRDDGVGRGYPGLRLLPRVMGTEDGLSKVPLLRRFQYELLAHGAHLQHPKSLPHVWRWKLGCRSALPLPHRWRAHSVSWGRRNPR